MFCLPFCVPGVHMCVWFTQGPEEGVVSYNWSYCCEPPCELWELNPGSLEKQPVLLTDGPSLQPHVLAVFIVFLFFSTKISFSCVYDVHL